MPGTNDDMRSPFVSDEHTRTLREVRMYASPDLPDFVDSVDLIFDHSIVRVAVDSLDDTVRCTRLSPPVPLPTEGAQALTSGFWEPLLGKVLTAAWHMTNDRGYRDAVELQLRDSVNEGGYTIVRIEAAASGLWISELTATRSVK